jgi:hypothetical protein
VEIQQKSSSLNEPQNLPIAIIFLRNSIVCITKLYYFFDYRHGDTKPNRAKWRNCQAKEPKTLQETLKQ